MKRSTAFWLVVVAQVLFLLGWAGYHEAVRQHAPVIRLQARPGDPRDLLRGDYMAIAYDISSVPIADAKSADAGITAGDVWIVLVNENGFAVARSASLEKPKVGPGEILVRATRGWNRITYGIETFYVPEGRGTPKFHDMVVEASVSPAHRLYIRRVLLDNVPYP